MIGSNHKRGKLMLQFKVAEGPWKKLFEGKFQERDVEIFSNPESVLLTIIYEKENNKIVGAVLEFFKVFAAIGEIEGFVETLPREVVVLEKHTKKETMKYLLLGSTPTYVEYKEQPFLDETDSLLKRLKTSSMMIKDISKAYDLTLLDLDETEERVREGFFVQPLLIPAITTAAHPTEAAPISAAVAGAVKGEILLGLTKGKQKVVEPLSLFTRTLVTGGKEDERKHAVHILVESALLSNVPAIIMDWKNKYAGLGTATKDRASLKEFGVEADPLGFPIKEFQAVEDIKVDVNLLNVDGFAELFGFRDANVRLAIKDSIKSAHHSSLRDLGESINRIKPTEELSAYALKKSIRILKLIDMMHAGLFGDGNDIPEISKSGIGSIGRAGIIEMQNLDEKTGLLIVHTIVKGLLSHYKEKGKTTRLRAMFVVPAAEKIIPAEASSVLHKEIQEALIELTNYGVGFVLGAERQVDISSEIIKSAGSKLNVVSGKDIGVQLRDRKSYRVVLRPALSVYK